MADLVTYVWARRTLYGPGNPPPTELWGELPADVWDTPPEFATPEEQSPTGNEPQPQPQAAAADDADDLAALIGGSLRQPEPAALDLPGDKDALLAFADAHHLDVDRRKGPAKLRAEIEAALDKGAT